MIIDNKCLAEMNKELDTLEGKLGPITFSIIIAQKLLLGGVCKLRFLTRGGATLEKSLRLLCCVAQRQDYLQQIRKRYEARLPGNK